MSEIYLDLDNTLLRSNLTQWDVSEAGMQCDFGLSKGGNAKVIVYISNIKGIY